MEMMKMLMLLSFACPALADHSLKCHNDYTNTFQCEWDTSALNSSPPVRPESNCSLRIAIEKRIGFSKWANTTNDVQMIADPTQPHIRRASMVFKSKLPIISTYRLYHEVLCTNYSNPVAKAAAVTAKESAVKVSPPQAVGVHGLNASWSIKLCRFASHKFEVQFRSAAQSWTDVTGNELMETQLMLPEDRLLLYRPYVIRVRAKLQLPNAIWSDWSEEYRWTSDVGLQPPTPTAKGVDEILNWSMSLSGVVLTGVTLTLIILFTVFIKCTGNKWSQRNHFSYIPDPSKFFGDLDSNHRGDFKSWLGPVLVRESFIKADGEMVSPVEVVKQKDTCDSLTVHKKSGGLLDRWDTTSKSSNFSNSTYFLSQSSKGPGDILEPCSAHSSYGPAGGISGPEPLPQRSTDVEEKSGASELELTLQRLEKLRQDTQSPDSGFAGGAEDSIEEADLPSPVSINVLPQDLIAPHPLLQPLLGLRCVAPTLGMNFMIPALDLQSACGPIEPSSGDYMPVKSVQNDC